MPAISGLGIGVGEQQEEAGFGRVGDPQLAAVEQEVVALVFRARRHGEGVGARPGFRERVGRHRIRRQARQVLRLLLRRGPAQQRVVADGVLHVHDHAGRGIHRREFLHRQNGLEEAAALAAVLLGNLDPHQAHLEELADDVLAEDAGLVHLADVRADLLARELAHRALEQLLVFGERGQRWRCNLGILGEHVRSLLAFAAS